MTHFKWHFNKSTEVALPSRRARKYSGDIQETSQGQDVVLWGFHGTERKRSIDLSLLGLEEEVSWGGGGVIGEGTTRDSVCVCVCSVRTTTYQRINRIVHDGKKGQNPNTS